MENGPASSDHPPDPQALLAWGCLPPAIVLRCWEDTAFAEQLRTSPGEALAAAGVDIGGLGEIRIVPNTPGVLHLVLPARPALLDQADPRQLTPDKW